MCPRQPENLQHRFHLGLLPLRHRILSWKEPRRIMKSSSWWMAHIGLEPSTSALLALCSDQLSQSQGTDVHEREGQQRRWMTLSLSTQLNYAAEAGKSVKGERGVTTIQFSLGWYSCNSNFYWYQLLELMLKKHVYYLHIGLQNQGTHISVKQMQGQFPTSWISAQSPCQILNYSLSSLWSKSDSYQD